MQCIYNQTDRTSLGYVDCQSILYTFVLTEVDACTLNCGHNVSNVRVVKVERKS